MPAGGWGKGAGVPLRADGGRGATGEEASKATRCFSAATQEARGSQGAGCRRVRTGRPVAVTGPVAVARTRTPTHVPARHRRAPALTRLPRLGADSGRLWRKQTRQLATRAACPEHRAGAAAPGTRAARPWFWDEGPSCVPRGTALPGRDGQSRARSRPPGPRGHLDPPRGLAPGPPACVQRGQVCRS